MTSNRTFVINVAVADLRGEAKEILNLDHSYQGLRESQLLFGEKILYLGEQGEWVEVAALEQLRFDPQRGWHPYLGWVKNSEIKAIHQFASPQHVVCAATASLSYGTYLPESLGKYTKKIPKFPDRDALCEEAKSFLEHPYLWGGRSFGLVRTSHPSSVDCSGFVNLLYRSQGISIPRNAHDQYLKSTPINRLELGDPLFLAKEKRVTHVILKLDDKTFIESPKTGQSIRLLRWGEEIWEKDERIHIFDRPHPYHFFFGTFIT